LGTINCGLTAAAVHRNTAAVAEFDAFLKSAQGKFRSATPRFFCQNCVEIWRRGWIELTFGVRCCLDSVSKGDASLAQSVALKLRVYVSSL
jgi:hypothetical protein